MQILGQTPVYLVDCTGKDTGHIFVGLIESRYVRGLYRLCEEEFDWMCGFEDSGFSEDGCTIFLDSGWGLFEVSWTAMKVREFVVNLSNGWNRPMYHFQGKRTNPPGY